MRATLLSATLLAILASPSSAIADPAECVGPACVWSKGEPDPTCEENANSAGSNTLSLGLDGEQSELMLYRTCAVTEETSSGEDGVYAHVDQDGTGVAFRWWHAWRDDDHGSTETCDVWVGAQAGSANVAEGRACSLLASPPPLAWGTLLP